MWRSPQNFYIRKKQLCILAASRDTAMRKEGRPALEQVFYTRRNCLTRLSSILAWLESSSLAAALSSLVAEFVWTTEEI